MLHGREKVQSLNYLQKDVSFRNQWAQSLKYLKTMFRFDSTVSKTGALNRENTLGTSQTPFAYDSRCGHLWSILMAEVDWSDVVHACFVHTHELLLKATARFMDVTLTGTLRKCEGCEG